MPRLITLRADAGLIAVAEMGAHHAIVRLTDLAARPLVKRVIHVEVGDPARAWTS